MKGIEALEKRRSVYQLNKFLPVGEDIVLALIQEAVRLVPDAFDMKSQRIVVALGTKQDQLWDMIYNVFGGKVDREKIDTFKSAYGTIVYFYDKSIVQHMQEQFPRYKENFPIWAQQSNGMIQFTIWTELAGLGIGANIQHYNPVIDKAVQELFNIPENYVLVAQMPFGGIVAEREAKAEEDISKRVRLIK